MRRKIKEYLVERYLKSRLKVECVEHYPITANNLLSAYYEVVGKYFILPPKRLSLEEYKSMLEQKWVYINEI